MLTRYTCRVGDVTTSGGLICDSGRRRMSVYGAEAALEGDLVSCPTCNTVGRIKHLGPPASFKVDGRQLALDGDECECRCSPLPKLIASQNRHGHRTREVELPETQNKKNDSSVAPASQHAQISVTPISSMSDLQPEFSLWIRVMDKEGVHPLTNRECTIRANGESQVRKTDANGYLAIRSRTALKFDFHVTFLAPTGPMQAQEGN